MAEHNLSEPTDIQVSPWHADVLGQYNTPSPPLTCQSSCKTCHINLMQVAAYEEVLRGGDVVLASHTGSGKTLAYLLPLVSNPCMAGSLAVAQLSGAAPCAVRHTLWC